MATMRIELSDDQMRHLAELASRLGVAPEVLLQISVRQMLAQPDMAFQETAAAVLRENAELYRRLA